MKTHTLLWLESRTRKMQKNTNNTTFAVQSDLSQVQKASAEINAFLKPLSLSDALLFDIRLCVEEAVINAMKYGNHFQKDKEVKVGVHVDGEQLYISVEDEGSGFDVKKLQDCTRGENLLKESGRGVYLIHSLMDGVLYNDKGNRIVMIKNLQKKKESV
jgi:serine/threonine-protein kinase RsbW